jgi:hypothetical protein
MTGEEVDKSIKEIWAMFRETDRRLDERFKETDRQLKELSRQIGLLGNKFGGFTEGMAFPSMQRILTEHFKMEHVNPRVLVRKNGESYELDVLAYADREINEVYVVEVKSRLREEHLDEMLRDLEKFPRFYPEHKNKALYGIIAAVDVTEQMKKKVIKAGLYLALIRDDTFCLDVPKGFKAKRFN